VSRPTWLIVQTQVALLNANLAVDRLNKLITRPDTILTGIVRRFLFQPAAHHCIFIDLSCHVVCFSREFLPRFWHYLHISSHSMIFFVSSFVLLSFFFFFLLFFLAYWNICWLEYFLEILCMKNPILSMCWTDIDISRSFGLLFFLV
jgi:hypothetical protein